MKQVESEEWLGWDSEHVWHPYTQMKLQRNAVGVDRASGSYLYLLDGRKILDGISSWWVTLHGHAHPAIARAIAEQASTLEQVIFAGFSHRPAAELAHRLLKVAPAPLNKVFFSDNGSTAVEVALKMCIQFWQHRGEERTTILALDGAYHGDTFGAMAVSAESAFTRPFLPYLFKVKRLTFPAPPSGAMNESNAFSEVEQTFLSELRASCDDPSTAGFIYEPLLLGAGGMLMWRPIVLEEALRILKASSVLSIADEVLTGFGRTGTMFASEQIHYAPDIMTLSKGLTAGFLPLGATLTTDEIYSAFLSDDRSRTFFHGHSFTGNPISCAAALASLSVFETEPVFDRIATIERAHRLHGLKLARKHDLSFRTLGTVAAFQPEHSAGYLSKQSLNLSARALSKGLLLRPLGDIIYLLPPYSTSVSDLEFAYKVIDELLTNIPAN